jgi:hypothetical protein
LVAHPARTLAQADHFDHRLIGVSGVRQKLSRAGVNQQIGLFQNRLSDQNLVAEN